MEIKHPKYLKEKGVVKGLSIATILLSSFTIIISIIALIYLVLALYAAQNTDILNNIANDIQNGSQAYIEGENLVVGQSYTDITNLTKTGLGFMAAFSAFSLLAASFSLFVAILTLYKTLRNKLKSNVFILNIISASISLISFSIVRFIVLIISIIYLIKILRIIKIVKMKHAK